MEHILRTLIAFHTVEDDIQAIHQGMDYIATFVAERGMHIERFEEGGHESLIATTQPGNKTPKVMLAAHLDVVHGADELFELRKADGRLYGRGTLDMKFAIAAYLQCIDDLQANLADYDIGLMITSDEELGGQDGTMKLLQEGYIPEVCILPDGGDNWQIQISSKGILYLRLQSYGTEAHGSRPWRGVNAIEPLMETLLEIKTLFKQSGPKANTLNIGKIHGGEAFNQVPAYAEAIIDIRTTSEAEKPPLLEQITGICASHNVALSILEDGSATNFSLDSPFIAPFARQITAVTGITVVGAHTLGSNDTRYFAPHNVPCVSLYPTGGSHHGPDEWISEEAFYQFRTILSNYLKEVARR